MKAAGEPGRSPRRQVWAREAGLPWSSAQALGETRSLPRGMVSTFQDRVAGMASASVPAGRKTLRSAARAVKGVDMFQGTFGEIVVTAIWKAPEDFSVSLHLLVRRRGFARARLQARIDARPAGGEMMGVHRLGLLVKVALTSPLRPWWVQH